VILLVGQLSTGLTLYDSAVYKRSALVAEHKIPPSTNEIVLLSSGLTCDFAGFPPARAFVSGDTIVSRPPARKQSSQRYFTAFHVKILNEMLILSKKRFASPFFCIFV
jgi:hypothetical protein